MVTMYDETGMDLFMQHSGLHGPRYIKQLVLWTTVTGYESPKEKWWWINRAGFTVWMSCLSPNQQLQRKQHTAV